MKMVLRNILSIYKYRDAHLNIYASNKYPIIPIKMASSY